MTDEAETPDGPEPLPQSIEVTAGDKLYRLGRIGFVMRLGAEPEVRKVRRTEFVELIAALNGVDNEQAARAITASFDHFIRNVAVSTWDVYDWLNTASGEVYAVAQSLQNGTHGMQEEDARAAAREVLDKIHGADREKLKTFLERSIAGV